MSDSPHHAALLITPIKADSKEYKRCWIVIDRRGLNKETIAPAYPHPNLTDMLDQLDQS